MYPSRAFVTHHHHSLPLVSRLEPVPSPSCTVKTQQLVHRLSLGPDLALIAILACLLTRILNLLSPLTSSPPSASISLLSTTYHRELCASPRVCARTTLHLIYA